MESNDLFSVLRFEEQFHKLKHLLEMLSNYFFSRKNSGVYPCVCFTQEYQEYV